MAGGCGAVGCSCMVKVGEGLQISGSGAIDSPYLIELSADDGTAFIAESTPTVALSLTGGGVPGEPFRLRASATVRVQDLTDVSDPEGVPAFGDTLVFVDPGGGVTPRWEMRPPPPNPAGAVNVGAGLAGDGSLATPLRVALIGTTAGGSTGGLEVYADSAGNLRAAPPVATAVEWDTILHKPTSFPTTPADFTGVLTVAKGGTGQNDLSLVTVGNATLLENRRVYTQSATPAGTAHPLNSLWFW